MNRVAAFGGLVALLGLMVTAALWFSPPIPLKQGVAQAISKAQAGEYEAASVMLERLARKHPDSADVWLNLGGVRLGKGDLEGADQAFQRVLKLNPDDWDAVAERAAVLVRKKEHAQGLDVLETVPPGKGRMRRRLRDDPIWKRMKDHPRMKALHKKHGMSQSSAGR